MSPIAATPSNNRRLVTAPVRGANASAPAPAAPAASASTIQPGGLSSALGDSLKFFYETFKPMVTRRVEEDPSDVNHPNGDDVAQAKAALAATRGDEQAALSRLGNDQRAQYQAVADLVKDDATARYALQQLLTGGQLTAQKTLVGGTTLLAQLDGLGKQGLASGVDRAALLGQLLGEVQNPTRINQQGKGTCAATTAQILLARRHPAEYVRLVADLAKPAGLATMAGGATLTRDPQWANPNDRDRTVSSRLFQPAVMNAAEGLPGETYHNENDMPYLGPVPLFMGGMTPGGSAKVNTQLEGVKYKNVMFMVGDRAKTFKQVTDALAKNIGSVPVGVMWNADGARGGHELQVDKVEGGRVYYTNPWGQKESMAEREFLDHLTSAQIPQA